MTDYTVQDLISLSYEQKPIDFQDAFNALIADKIASAIDARKVEVAQSMFAPAEEADQSYDDTVETDLEQEGNEDGEVA